VENFSLLTREILDLNTTPCNTLVAPSNPLYHTGGYPVSPRRLWYPQGGSACLLPLLTPLVEALKKPDISYDFKPWI
jgi:hypothetical protein